jgi:hypothetical protein
MIELLEDRVKQFFWYINERHAIYLKKSSGAEWPWTADPILQKYRFCEVFRELDKVTIWIRQNWREPYANHRNLWFAMCIARQINWPPTLAEIGFPKVWDPEKVATIMRARRARGDKVYTGAYMIPSGGKAADKVGYTVDRVLSPLYSDPPPISKATTLEGAWDALRVRYGFGGFLAYEVITDLRHTRYLRNAPDIMTWANAGPGAKRGIEYIVGRKTTYQECIDVMRDLLSISPHYLQTHVPTLEMRDVEHCLCELMKYVRVQGGGRMRSKYQAPGVLT